MPGRKVRVGVIGVGGIGVVHVSNYKKNPDCEVVALCDQSAEWLEHAKKEYDVRLGFTSYEELASCPEVDAVSVCLPTVFHAPVAIAALQAGKHILCEKPMTMDVLRAQAMSDAAKESGKILMISFNQRFGADVQFLKRYVDEGHLGEVYFVRTGWRRPMGALPAPTMNRATGAYNRNWFNEKAMGGGAALDLGSHVVDLAMYLMGFPKLKEVVGCTYTKFGPDFVKGKGVVFDADDHSVGFAKFENGASMQIEASYGSYIEKDVIFQAVYGDKGGAHRESGFPLKLFSSVAGAYTTAVPRLDAPGITPMDHFIECILQGKTPIITPEQGIAVTEILEGIYRSGEKEQP